MFFGYLWVTNQTGRKILQYKKDLSKIKNIQSTSHSAFGIPKKGRFSLCQLTSGYFNQLMSNAEDEENFWDFTS